MELTRDELYDLTSKLLLGHEMDETLFDQLLELHKGIIEEGREWVFLKTSDSSQTVTGSNTYLTAETLPSNFSRYLEKDPIALVNGNDIRYYNQIPLEKKLHYKDDSSKFYIDLPNNSLYLCGSVPGTYTMHQFYIRSSPEIEDGANWIFPGRFHPILAYDIAINYGGGIDYDDVNVRKASNLEVTRNQIWAAMEQWDAKLQRQSIENLDYSMEEKEQFYSGRIQQ